MQGEHFGTTEATEAFFAMTRLFQSNDVSTSCLPLAASVILSGFAVITKQLDVGTWEESEASTSENKPYTPKYLLKAIHGLEIND